MSKTPRVILEFRKFQMLQQLHEFYTFYDVYKTRNSIPNDSEQRRSISTEWSAVEIYAHSSTALAGNSWLQWFHQSGRSQSGVGISPIRFSSKVGLDWSRRDRSGLDWSPPGLLETLTLVPPTTLRDYISYVYQMKNGWVYRIIMQVAVCPYLQCLVHSCRIVVSPLPSRSCSAITVVLLWSRGSLNVKRHGKM
jgi:hypothetical protein